MEMVKNMSLQFDNKISLGNLITIAFGIVAAITAFVYIQTDLVQLKREQLRFEVRLERLETEAKADRRDVAEIKGDIRVIRQILESQSTPPRTLK
jgi:hypothetical protein